MTLWLKVPASKSISLTSSTALASRSSGRLRSVSRARASSGKNSVC